MELNLGFPEPVVLKKIHVMALESGRLPTPLFRFARSVPTVDGTYLAGDAIAIGY